MDVKPLIGAFLGYNPLVFGVSTGFIYNKSVFFRKTYLYKPLMEDFRVIRWLTMVK
jgi:hypothetical protein